MAKREIKRIDPAQKECTALVLAHHWEPVDTHGDTLECLNCGAHICWYEPVLWNQEIDGICLGEYRNHYRKKRCRGIYDIHHLAVKYDGNRDGYAVGEVYIHDTGRSHRFEFCIRGNTTHSYRLAWVKDLYWCTTISSDILYSRIEESIAERICGFYFCECGERCISSIPYTKIQCSCGCSVTRKRYISDTEGAGTAACWMLEPEEQLRRMICFCKMSGFTVIYETGQCFCAYIDFDHRSIPASLVRKHNRIQDEIAVKYPALCCILFAQGGRAAWVEINNTDQ